MAELERVPAVESIAVDVELLVDDIVNRLGAESYWSGVNALSTACPAPGNFPDQSRRDGVSYEDVKAVDLVRVGALSGIVFLYHSRGEEEILTGVAAALVEYQEDGTPGHAYKLSELLGGEGWARLTKSTVTRAGIRRCTQEVEYATYSDAGDILGELEVPARSPELCETIVRFTRP